MRYTQDEYAIGILPKAGSVPHGIEYLEKTPEKMIFLFFCCCIIHNFAGKDGVQNLGVND